MDDETPPEERWINNAVEAVLIFWILIIGVSVLLFLL